jgi:hypothetical protein
VQNAAQVPLRDSEENGVVIFSQCKPEPNIRSIHEFQRLPNKERADLRAYSMQCELLPNLEWRLYLALICTHQAPVRGDLNLLL